ncbi:MAG: BamA/TamA family outer membrane protein [Aliishimia sp.]
MAEANTLAQMTPLKAKIWACVLLCCLPCIGTAESVVLSPSLPDLQETLEATALVLSQDGEATNGDIVAAAQGDYQRLIAVLYGEGYFGPTISIKLAGREATSLSSLRAPAQVAPVTIRIEQGRQFRFGKAQVSPLPEGTELPEAFVTGRSAKTGRIRAAAQTGIEAWRAASHAKAELAGTDIAARHDVGKLDVDIRINPGPALRFGDLIVPEDSAVRAERLRKIAGLPVGAPYSPDELRRSRARLAETGAFRSVVIEEAEQPNADGTLDFTLAVEDATPRRVGFGAEVSSDEGVSLEAFWMHRNILGGGERLRFDLDIDGIGGSTGVDYALGVTLTVPGFKRPDDTLTIGATAERLDEPTFNSDIATLFVNRSRRFNDHLTASIGAEFRSSHTTDVFGSRSFRHIVFDAEATLDKRDDKLAPRKGTYLQFGISPFVGVSGSESGLRLEGDLRGYYALGGSTVFAGRLQLGSVLGPTVPETPPEFLFLSGGGGTVRGQDYQALGVELPQGRVGGRSFVGLSAEVRQTLGGNFGLVGFFDYGFVADGSGFQDGNDHAGIGIGARYLTGLGALRVDIATQASGNSAEDIFLYIGLGEAF